MCFLAITTSAATTFIHGFGTSNFERLAAKEANKYVGLLQGTKPVLHNHTSSQTLLREDVLLRQLLEGKVVIVVATAGHGTIHEMLGGIDPTYTDALAAAVNTNRPDTHLIHSLQLPTHNSSTTSGRSAIVCTGVTARSTLYAVYTLMELFGARFYVHGDVLPPPNPTLVTDVLSHHHHMSFTYTPRFDVRGLQPFHDFPMGPDYWQPQFWRALATNMVCMPLLRDPPQC
jgi:hypothetical protein